MVEIVLAGGWLMLPIIICSIVAIAIVIERFWSLNQRRIAPKATVGQVWTWIKNSELDAAKLRELRLASPLGQVLAAGLLNARQGRQAMSDAIEQNAAVVIHDLERYLSTLGTIAAITPLLGLLGTVIGMIRVFTEIMIQGTGNANALAGGISEALITTAAGLTVAIPSYAFHRYFVRTVDSLVLTLEQESAKLVEALFSDRRVEWQDIAVSTSRTDAAEDNQPAGKEAAPGKKADHRTGKDDSAAKDSSVANEKRVANDKSVASDETVANDKSDDLTDTRAEATS